MKSETDFSRKEVEAFNKGYRINKDGIVNYKDKEVNGFIRKVYKIFCFRTIEGKCQHCSFHRLQAYQKFGDKIYEKGIVVRHLDGNPLNNTWDNIEIGTAHDNRMDMEPEKRLRLAIHAAKNNIRWDCDSIKAMRASGMSYKEIKKETGITSNGTLSYIINERYINRDDMN